MAILSVQWYLGAMLLMDAGMLYKLWGPGVLGGTATLTGLSAPSLSQGTRWFDQSSDCPTGALLLTFAMVLLMTARAFAVGNPLNRWILLNAAAAETARLLLFSFLFSVDNSATAANTMLLTFMGCNAVYCWWMWYTTMRMLLDADKS